MGAEQNTAHGDPMPDNLHPLDGKMEPEARDERSIQDAAMVSMAVSLKRIADVLSGDDKTSGLIHALGFLADRMPSPYSQ